MEEERTRIEQGQVPEMESFVMTQKGALPPSINAIFSPPEHFNSSPSAEVATKDANGHPSPKESSPMPIPVEDIPLPDAPFYDSDEGVGADIIIREKETDSLEEIESKITAEEVDAALAELDSIPDVGCEAGEVEAEVEDEDDEDEGWSYYKMEPQQKTENEDLIVTGSSEITIDTLPSDSDVHQSSPEPRGSPTFVKEGSPSGSPPAPGSPRSVEGFVTSVELNTPEESYNTNLAINQSTDYFNGGQIEQSSGPFSVYVSSSPEPGSIESPPVNLPASMSSPSPPPPGEEEAETKLKEEVQEHDESVEIVHAQSTVEVIDTLSEIELLKEDSLLCQIPDIMTQSITGDFPTEPYVVPTEEQTQISPIVEDFHFTQETETFMENLMQEAQHTVEEVLERYTEEFSTQSEFISRESSEVVSEILESVTITEDKAETVTEEITSLGEDDYINIDILRPVLNNVQTIFPDILKQDLEPKFAQDINRPFEAPLDQMIASFHEDRTQLSDLICSSEIHEIPESREELPHEETPTADLLGEIQEMESLTEQISHLDVSEQVAKDEPATTPITPIVVATPPALKAETKKTTPASVPRTSVSKTVPPKPSPRSVGSKPTAGKFSPATGPMSAGPSPGARTAAPKRPTSLATASTKPLRKPEPAKPSATAKSRISTTSTTARTALASAATSRTTTAATKPLAAPTKTRAPPVKTTTTAPPPKTRVPASTTPKTSPIGLKSRVPATTAATQSSAPTRRPVSTTKPSATTTKTTTSTATSKVNVNGVASTVCRTGTRTTTTTTLASRKPLTAKTTTTTATRMTSGGLATRKPLSSTTTKSPSSTTTLKQRSAISPATKDTKNTTNRMLSTTAKTANTRPSSQPISRTTAATKTRPLLKTTKTLGGLKSEKAAVRKSFTKIEDSTIANGENKIVEEESTVEVKEKIVAERRVVEVHESAIEETISSVEDIVTLKQDNLLVNGDHS